MSLGLHLSEAAFDRTAWPKRFRPPLAGVRCQFPLPGMRPCHILPPRACQLSGLTSSPLGPVNWSRSAMKEGRCEHLIHIHLPGSLTARLERWGGGAPLPIQPIRGSRPEWKEVLDGLHSGLLSRQQWALMLLWHCEARESRQRAEGWRRRWEVKLERSDGVKRTRIKICDKRRRRTPVSVQEVNSGTTSGSRLAPRAFFSAGVRRDYGVWTSDEQKLMANPQWPPC